MVPWRRGEDRRGPGHPGEIKGHYYLHGQCHVIIENFASHRYVFCHAGVHIVRGGAPEAWL